VYTTDGTDFALGAPLDDRFRILAQRAERHLYFCSLDIGSICHSREISFVGLEALILSYQPLEPFPSYFSAIHSILYFLRHRKLSFKLDGGKCDAIAFAT